MRTSEHDVIYWTLAGLLAVALLVGLVLAVSLARGPERARFEVGFPGAVPCPSGERAPVCYRFSVTNAGHVGALVACTVSPSPGTTALFPNGRSEYTSATPISPDASIQLITKVDAEGSTPIESPSVQCRAG